MLPRVLIAYDGKHWFVRYIASVKHDGVKDEMVYTCDAPMGAEHDTLDEAVATIRAQHKIP